MSASAAADDSRSDLLDAHTWRPLRVLALARIAVAGVLMLGFIGAVGSPMVQAARPELFLEICWLYLAAAVGLFVLTSYRRLTFMVQVHLQILGDIAAIGALIYAAGTLSGGLAVLMMVSVAGGSLLAGARSGAFFAAVGTVMLLSEQTLLYLEGQTGAEGYTQVAAVGVAMFTIALVGAFVARRSRDNELLAARRGMDVADLERLNAQIVQRLERGVLALDPDGRVRLMNRAARDLLETRREAVRIPLAQVSAELAERFEAWRATWDGEEQPFTLPRGNTEVMPRFLPLGQGGRSGTLIFLENLSELRAQVQQAKLASLGRLTASIAHEIRNPLGAMMNAAQLLAEAEYLKDGDRSLLEIIRAQGQRLNNTVESVLQLSRRGPVQRERIALHDWIRNVLEEWREQLGKPALAFELTVSAEPVYVHADPQHLRQVLDNLARNALEHAGRAGEWPTVDILLQRDANELPVLEIADNGPGVDPSVRNAIFEPFVTTRSRGTGLGLYLCRELCEANRARLELAEADGGGARFRITFALVTEQEDS
ncbi:MAG TPA: ATP-binding protein [Pseudohaliea sp.]|nr:ATP-binding protein [Pseudohaliea sp.]